MQLALWLAIAQHRDISYNAITACSRRGWRYFTARSSESLVFVHIMDKRQAPATHVNQTRKRVRCAFRRCPTTLHFTLPPPDHPLPLPEPCIRIMLIMLDSQFFKLRVVLAPCYTLHSHIRPFPIYRGIERHPAYKHMTCVYALTPSLSACRSI